MCNNNACEAGSTPSCDDEDSCTVDSCDSDLDNCTYSFIANCNCGDGICDFPSEDISSCPDDCGGRVTKFTCGDGICNAGDGENCKTCPEDCNGNWQGPNNGWRFCCGDGIACSSKECVRKNNQCQDEPVGFDEWVCGDGICSTNGEDEVTCANDCS